jgi:hypothetical protein
MAALAAAIDGRREAPAVERLPTLTEVVELGRPGPLAAGFGDQRQPACASVKALPVPLPDMLELSTSVLIELQPRIESLFEDRLREALAPALARAADGLIRDTREQLSGTLRALVQEAVAKVLDRRQAG